MKQRTRRSLIVGGIVLTPPVAVLVALALYFPGQQFAIAFTLATGLGRDSLQARIDDMEDRAIREEAFDDADREFLSDFYTCLAKGARLTLVLPQSSRLMFHYLEGTGEPLRLDEGIFVDNAKVQKKMDRLRKRIRARQAKGRPLGKVHSSGSFHMPDPSQVDSVFGLYHGTLEVRPTRTPSGDVLLAWRAEVPWQWPSYDSLRKKKGDAHAESFPIPNLLCLVRGMDGALYVDNGLGEYIVHLGLAKPFLAWAEWTEVLTGA